MRGPAGGHPQRRSTVKTPFAPKIVRNRDQVCLRRLSDIPGASAIEASCRKDPDRHLQKALSRSLAAVAGWPGSGLSFRFHGIPRPHADNYKTGMDCINQMIYKYGLA